MSESTDWVESGGGDAVDVPVPDPVVAQAVVAPPVPAETPTENDPPLDEEGEPKVRDNKGRWKARAHSTLAGPDDVPRIRELTKKLRTVEQELAAMKAPKPADAPQPVFSLPVPPQPLPLEPEPTIEQFADKDDPYGAWQRALAKWDRKQEQLQGLNAQQDQTFKQTAQQAESYWAGVRQTHQQRLQAAVAANPAAAQALQSVKIQPPPVLDLSIMLDNDSAAVALFLAEHPDVLDDFYLLTASQPVTQQNVEVIRRKLREKMTAAGSGSVASSPLLPPAPRPPNPLRTAPMKTGESLPGDEDSMEAHERAFYRPGSRRR